MSYNIAAMERELKKAFIRKVVQKREYNLTEDFKQQTIAFFNNYYGVYGAISKIEGRKLTFMNKAQDMITTTTIDNITKDEWDFIHGYFSYWKFKDGSKGYITLDMDASKLTYEVTLEEKEIR